MFLNFSSNISLFKLSVAYPLRRYMSRWDMERLISLFVCDGYDFDLVEGRAYDVDTLFHV